MVDMSEGHKKIDHFIREVTWTRSTSPQYAEWPHSYIVREKLPYTKTSTFDYFAWWIVHHGSLGRFYNTTNYYWEHDGWVYWAMDNIINRCRSDQTYEAREAAGTLPQDGTQS